MAKFKVKKGDTVKVLTGESKGSIGRIVRVMPKMNRVVVEGVNMIKKHLKPTKENKGEISKPLFSFVAKPTAHDPFLGYSIKTTLFLLSDLLVKLSVI